MLPREYEALVAQTLRMEGWTAELTREGADMGVDIFASRGEERIAVQVKMYGGTSRDVNRAMIFELHGAAAFFETTGALLTTNGGVRPDAREAATKLGIEVRVIPAIDDPRSDGVPTDFEALWMNFLVPLQGKTLRRADGKANEILRVDWSGVSRRTSTGREGFIEIEIFRRTAERLFAGETVTRAWINNEYPGRASSGVILILSQVPLFELVVDPTLALRLRRSEGEGRTEP